MYLYVPRGHCADARTLCLRQHIRISDFRHYWFEGDEGPDGPAPTQSRQGWDGGVEAGTDSESHAWLHPHPCPPPSQGEGVYPSRLSDRLLDRRSRWRTIWRWSVAGAALAALGLTLVFVLEISWRARLEAPRPTLILFDRHGAFLTQIGTALWRPTLRSSATTACAAAKAPSTSPYSARSTVASVDCPGAKLPGAADDFGQRQSRPAIPDAQISDAVKPDFHLSLLIL